jgi:hypothetical protein
MTDAAPPSIMTRRRSTPVWPLLVLMACLVGAASSAQAARPESVEVRDGAGSRGLLTITVMDDGNAYIAPDHLAALLKGAWSVKGDRGTLTVGKRVAEFTRGQPRATVDGQTVALDAAARVSGQGWLVSRDFLGKGLPRLAPGVSRRRPSAEASAKTVQAGQLASCAALSFVHAHCHRNRARLAYAVVARDERCVRLPGLSSPTPVSRRPATVVQRSAGRGTPRCSRSPRAPGEVKHTVQDPVASCSTSTAPGRGPGEPGAAMPRPLIVMDAATAGTLGAVG